MVDAMEGDPRHGWFFTAPWEPVYVRRGDALGLRGLNDLLGDTVAPGLTNRTHDARWITILAWCLVHSHEAWVAGGGSERVRSREQAAQRYAWLRPLELMWVARTLQLAPDDTRGRQLAGQRRVRAWLRDDCVAPRFAMTGDQYRGYRQTGMYGAYRTLIRSLPEMTRDRDGWTPGRACQVLASAADRLLGKARYRAESGSQRKRRRDWEGKEDTWWLREWPDFRAGSPASLPHKRDVVVKLEEAEALRPLLFESDAAAKRRSLVASVVGAARAKEHQALCEHIVDALREEPDSAVIRMIPPFARLADAGVAAMDAVARELTRNRRGPSLSIRELAARPIVHEACAELTDTGKQWLASERTPVRHLESAERLARAVAVETSKECLGALLHHHTWHGGGVRWFAVRDELVEPNLRLSDAPSARYRFRLWSLARMAVQVGKTRAIPGALMQDMHWDDEEEDEP